MSWGRQDWSRLYWITASLHSVFKLGPEEREAFGVTTWWHFEKTSLRANKGNPNVSKAIVFTPGQETSVSFISLVLKKIKINKSSWGGGGEMLTYWSLRCTSLNDPSGQIHLPCLPLGMGCGNQREYHQPFQSTSNEGQYLASFALFYKATLLPKMIMAATSNALSTTTLEL